MKLDINFINSIPKVVNENGCWIPTQWKPYENGYITIRVETIRYLLHRLSMCISQNLDYSDYKMDTRHSEICVRACFNPEHLSPGSQGDNNRDIIKHGANVNLNKECCSKCGGPYKTIRIKSGPRRGQVFRSCILCTRARDRNRKNR